MFASSIYQCILNMLCISSFQWNNNKANSRNITHIFHGISSVFTPSTDRNSMGKQQWHKNQLKTDNMHYLERNISIVEFGVNIFFCILIGSGAYWCWRGNNSTFHNAYSLYTSIFQAIWGGRPLFMNHFTLYVYFKAGILHTSGVCMTYIDPLKIAMK